MPSWAKDVSVGNRMLNARVESLTEKPAFKKAAAVKRHFKRVRSMQLPKKLY